MLTHTLDTTSSVTGEVNGTVSKSQTGGWRKTPAEEEQSQEMLSLWWQTAAWQLPEQLFGTFE